MSMSDPVGDLLTRIRNGQRAGKPTITTPASGLSNTFNAIWETGAAASNTYLFFTEVLPKAIKKYGGVDPDALRKAALDVDLPEGGTMLGFGVKFPGEGAVMAGQNERSFPVVIQYIDDKSYVVWPKSQAMREAVLPLPKGTTYSNQ